jgi:hypothetical protein
MKNKVIVGSLTQKRAEKALQGNLADIVYSDPPWGPGNLKYWRTMNGQKTKVDWENFIELFCFIVKKNTKKDAEIFVEMGSRWIDQLSDTMSNFGIIETQRFRCYYKCGSKRYPNYLWHSGTEIDLRYREGGLRMTKEVIGIISKPGLIVFDPCCGNGMTAKCALHFDMYFAGVELNPKRAAKTKQIIRGES